MEYITDKGWASCLGIVGISVRVAGCTVIWLRHI